MKKKFVFMMTSALLAALSANAAFAAETGVPSLMEPNSVIIYDDKGNPSVVSGGYAASSRSSVENEIPNFNIDDYMRKVPADATDEERESIEKENQVIFEALEDVKNGVDTVDNNIEIIPGMKVIYDENGELLNIYYADDFCPEGYTIHGNEAHIASNQKDDPAAFADESSATWGKNVISWFISLLIKAF